MTKIYDWEVREKVSQESLFFLSSLNWITEGKIYDSGSLYQFLFFLFLLFFFSIFIYFLFLAHKSILPHLMEWLKSIIHGKHPES